jgi:hypothetical protein
MRTLERKCAVFSSKVTFVLEFVSAQVIAAKNPAAPPPTTTTRARSASDFAFGGLSIT